MKFANRLELKCSLKKTKGLVKLEVMDVLMNSMGINVSQHICVSTHDAMHFICLTILFVDYSSVEVKKKVCNLRDFMARIKKYTFRTRIQFAFLKQCINYIIRKLCGWYLGLLLFIVHWILSTLNIIPIKEREKGGQDFPRSYFESYAKVSSTFHTSRQSQLWRKMTKLQKSTILILPSTCNPFWKIPTEKKVINPNEVGNWHVQLQWELETSRSLIFYNYYMD